LNNILQRGWKQVGPTSVDHPCGAGVRQLRKNWWAAKTVNGALTGGFATSEQACAWVEANDPAFWSIGRPASAGNYFGIDFESSFLDIEKSDHVVACSLPDELKFPQHLKAPFKRHFLGSAACVRCGSQPTEIMLRQLVQYGSSTMRRIPYIVCPCGYPVWRISADACFRANNALVLAERGRIRRESLKTAGGKNTSEEIQAILALQEDRCIYCNVLFSDTIRPTRDHLLPVEEGGADWSLNIVLACQSCNSRRGTIPFRTYCRLLSPTQNRRILKHLGRRIQALDLDNLPDEAFTSFLMGLENHSRGGSHHSARARRNAAANQLLPSRPSLILRKALALRPKPYRGSK
jgi:DNA-directed RNA polymerase subunit RPC12/RpoP